MKLLHITFLLLLVMSISPPFVRAQEATPAPIAAETVVMPGRPLRLSPDGALVAVRDGKRLCVVTAHSAEVVACADLESHDISMRMDDLVWSPDSTRLAFAEDGFMTSRDGDLWVIDAATGDLSNLTDDGFEGKLFDLSDDASGRASMDVLPAWSPDGTRIAFSRSDFVDGEPAGNVIAVVPAAGGEVRTVSTVSPGIPGVLYTGMIWSPDGEELLYSNVQPDRDDPVSGIYAVTADGGTTRKLLEADPALGRPAIFAISADGATGLIIYLDQAMGITSEEPVFWLLDLASGQVTPLPTPPGSPEGSVIEIATFSPDGRQVLSVVNTFEPDRVLQLTDVASGESSLLALVEQGVTAGIDRGAPLGMNQGLDWGADGTVLVTASAGFDGEAEKGTVLLFTLPTDAPPVITPTPGTPVATPVSSGSQAPGISVVTNDDTKLRAAPSTDAVSVLDLPNGTALTVIGVPREAEGFTWIPVEEPETGTIGYVRAELITGPDS